MYILGWLGDGVGVMVRVRVGKRVGVGVRVLVGLGPGVTVLVRVGVSVRVGRTVRDGSAVDGSVASAVAVAAGGAVPVGSTTSTRVGTSVNVGANAGARLQAQTPQAIQINRLKRSSFRIGWRNCTSELCPCPGSTYPRAGSTCLAKVFIARSRAAWLSASNSSVA